MMKKCPKFYRSSDGSQVIYRLFGSNDISGFQEISEELNTSPTAIRDNIDTLIEASWRKNPDLIRSISNYPLPARPSVKRFLEIACNYLMRARGIIV